MTVAQDMGEYMFIAGFRLVTALYGEALGTVMKMRNITMLVKGILERNPCKKLLNFLLKPGHPIKETSKAEPV